MNWFKHSTNAVMCEKLTKLIQKYRMQGLGMYWLIVEMIYLRNGCCRLVDIYSWACPGMKKVDIHSLLHDEELELFEVSDDTVYLVPNVANGIEPSDGNADAPRVGAEASADASAEVSAEVSAEASVSYRERIEIERGEGKPRLTRRKSFGELSSSPPSPEHKRFYEGMARDFPRVCLMKDALSYEQYLKLNEDGYTDNQIRLVLSDMENYPKLTTKYVSAYLTLLKWLMRGN